MIELNFIRPKETHGAVKLTVHKTGKLGFSKNAIELLGIEKENLRHCKFANNTADTEDEDLYMVLVKEEDGMTFNISKAGEYYYIKAKNFLLDSGIDYSDESRTVIFDITEVPDSEYRLYKLKKRIVEKRKKAEQS